MVGNLGLAVKHKARQQSIRPASPLSSAMQRRLLDILACPMDKHYPLQMIELNSTGDKIVDGVLFCDQCKRFYPIVDEIPMMLPDELRNKKEDLEFLAKWRSRLPASIIESASPYNLS